MKSLRLLTLICLLSLLTHSLQEDKQKTATQSNIRNPIKYSPSRIASPQKEILWKKLKSLGADNSEKGIRAKVGLFSNLTHGELLSISEGFYSHGFEDHCAHVISHPHMVENSYIQASTKGMNVNIDYKLYDNIGTWYFDVECDWDGWKYYFPQYFGGACLGRIAFCPYISKNFLYVENALFPLAKKKAVDHEADKAIDQELDKLAEKDQVKESNAKEEKKL